MAHKHAKQRIIYWPPFWNKVYTDSFFPYFMNFEGYSVEKQMYIRFS